LLAETAEWAYLFDAARDVYLRLDFERGVVSWRFTGDPQDWVHGYDIGRVVRRG
jgi:hypothetical protein